jgi:hypothetical protein
MADLRRAKDDIFSKADQARRAGKESSSALEGLRTVISAFGPQLEIAVTSVNNIADSRQAEVRRIARQADLSRRAALVLYVLGTALVLAGTALTKFVN